MQTEGAEGKEKEVSERREGQWEGHKKFLVETKNGRAFFPLSRSLLLFLPYKAPQSPVLVATGEVGRGLTLCVTVPPFRKKVVEAIKSGSRTAEGSETKSGGRGKKREARTGDGRSSATLWSRKKTKRRRTRRRRQDMSGMLPNDTRRFPCLLLTAAVPFLFAFAGGRGGGGKS